MKVKLKLGDCLDVLKRIPDNTIDSCVTDPPYGLKFMGKKWDTDVPSVEIWKEVYRVLKPGGHLLSFFGTRTYHRGVVNIEDAGFEIRDMVSWVYGCYSEDTECLTERGWLKYDQLITGDKILQWNKDNNELSWYPVEEIFIYDAPNEMISIKNRHTDQLVTKNHSVYTKIQKHSRNPKPIEYEVIKAQELKSFWHKDFPLAGMLNIGVKNEDAYLVGWWLTDAWLHNDGKACMFSQSKFNTLDKLREALKKSNCKFSEYIKLNTNINHKEEHIFYVTGNLSEYLIKKFSNRELTWDVLKWDFNSRFQLVDGLLDGDGSRKSTQYSECFWSLNRERLDIFQALCVSLNIRSHIDYKKGVVYLNRKTNTTELQNKHPITSIAYSGNKVWCLNTQTGAFVVRRNGKAFISGNSGFPKSTNIGKEIDKIRGNERIVVGQDKSGSKRNCMAGDFVGGVYNLTQGKSEWEGWGTALKPAQEPIVLARKPLEEKNIASNVLKYGTGAINIDDCRIEVNEKIHIPQSNPNNRKGIVGTDLGITNQSLENFQKSQKESIEKPQNLGRFPANFIHDGSDEVLELFPESKSSGGPIVKKSSSKNINGNLGSSYGKESRELGSSVERRCDSGSAARFFYCAKTSVKEREQGLEKKENEKSNIHPTVKPVDLMKYLCRLITPPKGIVLDPFMGSGSTGMAALQEDFSFIGIEKEEQYFNIAEQRIKSVIEKEDVFC